MLVFQIREVLFAFSMYTHIQIVHEAMITDRAFAYGLVFKLSYHFYTVGNRS